MTSSELPELLALSDRILVLHEGRLVGVLEGDERTQENVLRMAVTGIGPKAADVAALEDGEPRSPDVAAIGI
jgi:hypothetical protein